MKKIIKKISGAIQVILLAPIQLPGKFIHIIKYIGLGLGIIESVITDKDEQGQKGELPEDGTKPTIVLSDSGVFESSATRAAGVEKAPDRIVKYDLETGKEVPDEAE